MGQNHVGSDINPEGLEHYSELDPPKTTSENRQLRKTTYSRSQVSSSSSSSSSNDRKSTFVQQKVILYSALFFFHLYPLCFILITSFVQAKISCNKLPQFLQYKYHFKEEEQKPRIFPNAFVYDHLGFGLCRSLGLGCNELLVEIPDFQPHDRLEEPRPVVTSW